MVTEQLMTDAENGPVEVTVRYWAAARDAAGRSEEKLIGRTLGDVIAAAGARHGPELVRLLGICSYLVGDQPAKRADAAGLKLTAGAVVEVLPPFAGGSGLLHPEA
jgi:sulfur-carrier protein